MTLISDFRELELDQESYPNSNLSGTVDRILHPCRIGDQLFERVLLDLGASINLLPYTVYEKLRACLTKTCTEQNITE
jgi:hypothetical protein